MKNFIGFIFCILIAVFMAVMIDGSGGIMIAVILIAALVISQIIMLVMRGRIEAEVICSQQLLAKGESLSVRVKLKKHTILPTPFIEVEVASTPQLAAADKTVYRLAVASRDNYENIDIPFTAKHCGMSSVEIKRIELIDYLGLTRYRIDLPQSNMTYQVRVMPDVRDTGTQAEILKTTSDNAAFDDSEEETSETAVGSTGTPGYEHRVYVPGDPIKKINWKLSSKRDIYMIRLDEKLAVSSQTFVLDCPKFDDMSELSYIDLDIIVEGCLAMLSMLVRQGLECEFYYYVGKWQSIDVKSMADVLELQQQLSYLVPITPSNRLPQEALKKGGAVCFTTADVAHESLLAQLFEYPDIMLVTHENSGLTAANGNIWTCSSDLEFERIV